MSSPQAKTGVEVERLPELPEPSIWGSFNVLTQKESFGSMPITSLQPGVYKHRKLYDESAVRAYATAALAAERAEAVRMREILQEANSLLTSWSQSDYWVWPESAKNNAKQMTLELLPRIWAALSPSQG